MYVFISDRVLRYALCFFNDTATTEIYTLSLHYALPISHETAGVFREYERCATTIVDAALSPLLRGYLERLAARAGDEGLPRSEEHTSELQSRQYLVCRLLLEKKTTKMKNATLRHVCILD